MKKNKFSDFLIKWASENGHTKVVKFLIKIGVDVTIDDNAAIIYASRHGHAKIVDLLIRAGADVNANYSAAIKDAIISGDP